MRDRRPETPYLPLVVIGPAHMALWCVLFEGQLLPQKGSDTTDGHWRSFIVLRKGVFLKIQQ